MAALSDGALSSVFLTSKFLGFFRSEPELNYADRNRIH